MDSVDMILRIYHNAVQSGDLQVGQSAKLDSLLEKVSCLTSRLSFGSG
jgi:homocitrate synthase